MRFKLILNVKRGSVLPLNYQYPLSSFLYRTFNSADPDFAEFLHSKGYGKERPFKFFNFSNLNVPQREIYDDRLIIKSKEVSLKVSFLLENAAEKFINGLFKNQHIGLGDKKSQVDFEIQRIEALPAIPQEKMHIKLNTPLMISKKEVTKNGTNRTAYLSPEHPEYAERLKNNLIRKYLIYTEQIDFDQPLEFENSTIQWELKSKPKSKLVTVKSDTPQESKLKGFQYEFKLEAPKELIQVGLAAGFGEKNSLGFGWGEMTDF